MANANDGPRRQATQVGVKALAGGFDGIDPELREDIARYLSSSSGDAPEAQRLLVRAYYHGHADGVLRERAGLLRFVEMMVATRVEAYLALEATPEQLAQHEGAAEVLFTLLSRLLGDRGRAASAVDGGGAVDGTEGPGRVR